MQALPGKTVIFGLRRTAAARSPAWTSAARRSRCGVPAGTTGASAVDRLRATELPAGGGLSHGFDGRDDRGPDRADGLRPTGPLVAGRWVRGSQVDAGRREGQHGDREDLDHVGRRTARGACRAATRTPARAPIAALRHRLDPRRPSGQQPLIVGAQDAAGNVAPARYTRGWTTSRRSGCTPCRRRRCLATLERLHDPLADSAPGPRSDHSRLVPAVRTSGLLDRRLDGQRGDTWSGSP